MGGHRSDLCSVRPSTFVDDFSSARNHVRAATAVLLEKSLYVCCRELRRPQSYSGQLGEEKIRVTD
jgi:hypothetical protein